MLIMHMLILLVFSFVAEDFILLFILDVVGVACVLGVGGVDLPEFHQALHMISHLLALDI